MAHALRPAVLARAIMRPLPSRLDASCKCFLSENLAAGSSLSGFLVCEVSNVYNSKDEEDYSEEQLVIQDLRTPADIRVLFKKVAAKHDSQDHSSLESNSLLDSALLILGSTSFSIQSETVLCNFW